MDYSNAAYHRHLISYLPALAADTNARERLLFFGTERIGALALLDFEPVRPLLVPLYANRKNGRAPRDPVLMLRALLVMSLCRMTAINSFARRLRGEPELRVLIGLRPDDKPPGVGTFYDFLRRLVDGPYQRSCEHQRRPSERLSGRRFERKLKSEKKAEKAQTQAELAHSHQGRIENLVEKRLASLGQGLPEDLGQRLNEILTRTATLPSARAGVLGDTRTLTVAGDGTAVISHADGDGHALCTCKKDGQKDCTCPRNYSDPEATWGFDSHRECYFFGFRLHVLSTRGIGDDLPLHIAIAGAHTPDAVLAVDALVNLVERLKAADIGARITNGIFDKGYDAAAFYKLNRELNINPIIPLAKESKTPTDDAGIPRDANGTPLCPAEVPMRLHQRDLAGHEIIYNCPVKRPGRTDGKLLFKTRLDECPRKALCEPDSVMGPIVRIRLDGDPRMNLPIPRGTPLFDTLYTDRTCTERYNSTFKSKGDINTGAYRRQHIVFAFAIAHAIELHARAWSSRAFGEGNACSIEKLLDWMTQIGTPIARAA